MWGDFERFFQAPKGAGEKVAGSFERRKPAMDLLNRYIVRLNTTSCWCTWGVFVSRRAKRRAERTRLSVSRLTAFLRSANRNCLFGENSTVSKFVITSLQHVTPKRSVTPRSVTIHQGLINMIRNFLGQARCATVSKHDVHNARVEARRTSH